LWVTQADLAQVNGHGVIHLTESSHTWYGKASESETKPAFAIIPWPPSGAWVQAVVSWREYPILVAVEDNLVSFDGAAWRIMPEQPATGLPSILSLTVGPDDALWLGTSAGLMRFDGSEWITYRFLPAADAVESIAVGDIAFDAVGTAWMVSTAGIVRFDGQRAVVYTLEMPELLSIYAGRIAVGEQGSLWLAAHGHGLVEVALPEAP
jgi:ligand-binding sensor domain-containing protein